MNKRGFLVSLSSVILSAALFAQSEPLNFVQTGAATHELDSEELVAAHAILPIGQEVLVTNLESGAQITVTITERISPSSSRIIDLSSAAAAAAAMFDDVTQVTIEATLKRDESAAVAASPAAPATPATPQATAAQTASAAAAASPTAPATSATAPATAARTAPAAAAASPAARAAESAAIPPSSSTGYTPTSEITPVVPPWETGYVPWPAPQNDPWLPELAQPWISGIEREQRSPRVVGPAQTPTPAFAPPPVSAPPQEPARGGPTVASGARNNALYRVQVGAFSAYANAQEAFNRLLNAGFSPVFEVQGGLTRVQIPWVRGYELQVIGQRLNNIGFREIWIRAER
jgi:cell division protein FtsN